MHIITAMVYQAQSEQQTSINYKQPVSIILGLCINRNGQHGLVIRLIESFDLNEYHTDFCDASSNQMAEKSLRHGSICHCSGGCAFALVRAIYQHQKDVYICIHMWFIFMFHTKAFGAFGPKSVCHQNLVRLICMNAICLQFGVHRVWQCGHIRFLWLKLDVKNL